MPWNRIVFPAWLLIVLPSVAWTADVVVPPGETPTFEQHVRPILRAHCFDCHGATEKTKGGLDLRLVRLMLQGGDSGPAIVAGKAADSYLLERVRAGEMPPGETKLTPAEIATLERWIAAGAKTARPEPETVGPGLGITPEERAWWAFQPIKRPAVPQVPADARARTPIDSLLLKAMPAGLSFSEDADRRVLMLRVYFDLIGLPPTPDDAVRFLNDNSPDAYERLIDDLLASPHYGERWGRHWLDIAGYADSEGRTAADAVRTWSYKYRDYVIRSLNADKPFDRLIHEQLAGDELAGPIQGDLTAEQIELLTATGFLRLAADGTGAGDNSPEARNGVIADTLKIVTTTFLGLSVACAQCHDHRYDPILQTDYYALRAVFEPAFDWQKWKTPPERHVSLYTAANRAKAAEIEVEAQKTATDRSAREKLYLAEAFEKELRKFDERLREPLRDAYNTPADKRSPEQKELLAKNPSVNISPGVLYQYNQPAADDLKKYDERIAQTRAQKPAEEFLRVLTEPPESLPETKLFYRGDYRQPKETIAPAVLTVLSPENAPRAIPAKATDLPTTGRRLAFARWLTSRENPLTARVIVNRVWMHHFGRGLVDTPADFGRLGTQPTHPELLDWLADEFIAQGWSLKKLHKQILISTAFRQSSRRDPTRNAIDSDNRFLSRKSLLRLDAEILRDRVLATTGDLDRTLFGPPGAIKEDETGQVIVDAANKRRSTYIQQRRSQPVAMLQAFDAPVMETNCERRPSSTVATQSLMLMNGDFVLDQAARLAARVIKDSPASVDSELAADLPALTQSRTPLWQFGYGRFDAESKRTASFTAFPHWTGSSWQGGATLPDPQIGFAFLNAAGGHTGVNPGFAAIRRWTAPASGVVRIAGTLNHPSENGDGVQGQLVSSRSGAVGEWAAKTSQIATNIAELAVTAGDTLDFITNCRDNVTSDSFQWTVEVTLLRDGQPSLNWKSAEGFHGPLPQVTQLKIAQVVRAWQLALCRMPTRDELTLTIGFLNRQLEVLSAQPRPLPNNVTPEQQALTNLCQTLLIANAFLYVE